MERVQAPTEVRQGEQGEVVPSLAPFPEAAPAPQLEQLAISARMPGTEGDEACQALHAALEKLAPTEENGRELLRLLDDGAFNELRMADGASIRERAVEALLRLGYPWALQIHPDELAWYRGMAAVRTRNKWLLLLGIFSLGAVAELFLLRFF